MISRAICAAGRLRHTSMKAAYIPAELIAFEDEIAALFAAKCIHAPVHLAGGNEEQLIRVFQDHVNEQDWVLCSWRSHFHCLLKGVPPDQVRQAILDGRSISLCFPEYRVLSSGIAGGTAPIAVGLAMGIKRKGGGRKVACFIGDMAAEMGIVHESVKYAVNHDLPVLWIVEDNGLSVSTDTTKAWGCSNSWIRPHFDAERTLRGIQHMSSKLLVYQYKLTRPHVVIGRYVEF